MKAVVAPEATRRQNGTTRGCLAVIAFLYSAAVFNVVVPRLGYSVYGASHLLALTLLTLLASLTYLQCVYCDPGGVPPGWEPDPEQQAGAAVLQVKRRGGGRRYCKKCAAFKPPRTHHCRRCGRCILRMDHHCAWTNNCIGQGNYRAFLLMCLYITLACLHALGLLLYMDARLVQVALGWDEGSQLAAAAMADGQGSGGGDGDDGSRGFGGSGAELAAAAGAGAGGGGGEGAGLSSLAIKTGWRGPLWLHAVVQVLATSLGLPVAVGLLVLLLWNAFLFLRNQTTIEYHEGVTAQFFAAPAGAGASSGGQRSHPFDLGPHDNLLAVCGDAPACWLLPGRAAAEGDGLAFASPWDGQAVEAASKQAGPAGGS